MEEREIDAQEETSELLFSERKSERKSETELIDYKSGPPPVSYFLGQNTILVNLVVMTIVWTVAAFSWYVNNLFIKYIPGDFEDNVIVMTSMDLVSAALGGYISEKFGTRQLFFAFGAISATAFLFLVLFS